MAKNYSWLCEELLPRVQVEQVDALYSQHLQGKGIQHIAPKMLKIFRGLPRYWGDIDPQYQLWHIRHSYFGNMSGFPHFDQESVFLIIRSGTVELVCFQCVAGVLAYASVTGLAPIWGHIVAPLAKEKGWQIV